MLWMMLLADVQAIGGGIPILSFIGSVFGLGVALSVNWFCSIFSKPPRAGGGYRFAADTRQTAAMWFFYIWNIILLFGWGASFIFCLVSVEEQGWFFVFAFFVSAACMYCVGLWARDIRLPSR